MINKYGCSACNFNGKSQWAYDYHKNTEKHKNIHMVNVLQKDEYSYKYYRINSAVMKRQSKINYYKKRFNREIFFIKESTIKC